MRVLTPDELLELVDEALREATDDRWLITRRGARAWSVEPPREWHPDAFGSRRMYAVQVDEHSVVVSHSNTDAGAITLDRVVRSASLVEVRFHPIFSITLADVFAFIFEQHPPDVHGLT
jgi:hypothetical protein